MQSEPTDNNTQKEKRTRRFVVLTIMAIALVVPSLVIVSTNPSNTYIQLIAMTWIWTSNYGYIQPTIPSQVFTFVFGVLPLMFLRLVLVYMMNRRYLGYTTRKRVLVVALLAEAQPVGVFSFSYVLMFILSPGFFSLYQYAIPVPALIIVTLILLKMRPPLEHRHWVEDSSRGGWWNAEETPLLSAAPRQLTAVDRETAESEDTTVVEEDEDESSTDDWLKESQ